MASDNLDNLTEEQINALVVAKAGGHPLDEHDHVSDDELNRRVKEKILKLPQDQSNTGDVAQTALESFGKEATLGYLPQIQAGVEKLLPNPTANVDESLRAQGFNLKQAPEGYLAARDANIRRMQEQEARNPNAALGGSLAGIGSSALMAGALAPTAAPTFLGRAAQAAATGGAIGAAANPGDIQGEISPLQLGERAQRAGIGAAVGPLTQGALEGAGKVAGALKSGAGKIATKVGSTLSGVPEQEIKTYAERTDAVNKLIKSSGGDVTTAADQVRGEIQQGLQQTKQRLGKQVADALESAPKDKNIDINPLLKTLEEAKAKLNPNLKKNDITELQSIIDDLKREAPEGLTNLSSLNEIKVYLQDAAEPAYMKGGQIFSRGDAASKIAKSAAAKARVQLNDLAPEVRTANDQLFRMRRIESNLNKNLITPDKPEAALLAAGSGTNFRNRKMLERLEEMSGVPTLGRAEELAAARTFANPSFIPADATGKTATRVAAGAGLGGLMAGPVGAVLGGATASPAAVKYGVNLANLASRVPSASSALSGAAQRNPVETQALIAQALRRLRAIEGNQ